MVGKPVRTPVEHTPQRVLPTFLGWLELLIRMRVFVAGFGKTQYARIFVLTLTNVHIKLYSNEFPN